MKNFLFIIVIILGGMCCFSSCSKSSLNIEGQITNVKEADLYFWSFKNGDYVLEDSVKVEDGKFSCSFECGKDELLYVTSVNKFRYSKVLFLENKSLKIEGMIFRDFFRIKTLKGDGLNAEFFAYEQSITNIVRKYKNKGYYKEKVEFEKKFINDNKTNILGVYALYEKSKDPSNLLYCEKIFTSLSDEVTQLVLYKEVQKNIASLKSIAVGNRAIDFSFKTLEGENVDLNYFNGKVLLIDFWASWCGPCCGEMPHVVELYNKYHDRGLDVLAYSLDSKKENWEKAIVRFNMKWHNYSELNKWNSSLSKKYFVRGIPYNVLIDTEGNIVAKGLHGKILDETIDSLLK